MLVVPVVDVVGLVKRATNVSVGVVEVEFTQLGGLVLMEVLRRLGTLQRLPLK